ncbi:MAG: chloride channel protein [Alphaproteobacteria bacterium]|nr:chloride channel protein [Alphaproteobacteria bacterium]MCB9698174.1 chloride channel protein [Alphaproteobacteria bacterium]
MKPWTRDPALRLLGLGAAAGVVGGLAAGLFDGVRLLVALVCVAPGPSPWIAALVPIPAGALAGWLVERTTTRRQLGMSGLVERLQLRGGRVPLVDAALGALGGALAVGSGHSGGREAPVAAIAAAIGAMGGERAGSRPRELRILAASAAAAGIAASFATPLGSAVFGLEVLLGSFALDAFGPMVAATVVGTALGQVLLGDRVALQVGALVPGPMLEWPLFGVLGAAAGLTAIGWRRALELADSAVGATGLPGAGAGALAGAAAGLCILVGLPQVAGTSYPFVRQLLLEPGGVPLGVLALVLLAKVATGALTWGGRTGAGLLAPLLVVGAVLGVLVGRSLDTVWPALQTGAGVYGVIGMGALAAATLRAPVAMTLVVFELTQSTTVVPPMLLATAVATLVARALDPSSLIESQLLHRGVDLHERLPADLRAVSISDLRRSEPPVVVRADADRAAVLAAFRGTRDDLVWVVDADGHYLGAIDVQDVLDAVVDDLSRTAEGLSRPLPTLRAAGVAADAVAPFGSVDADELPVVDEAGRLVGVVEERSLLRLLEAPVTEEP